MFRSLYTSVLMLSLPLAFSACGGSGGQAGMMPAVSAALVPLAVTLRIPATTAQSNTRGKQYISAGTHSAKLTITDANGTPQSTAADCTTTCTLGLQVAPGQVQLHMELYSDVQARGQLLSSGAMTTSIVSGRQNTISVSLGGIVNALSLSLEKSVFTAGTAATGKATVVALDASGNTIIGSDPFTTPISLRIAAPFSLSSRTVASPADAVVTLSYNGASTVTSQTLTATIDGSTTQAAANVATRSAVTLARMPAVNASAFIDSVGINTHMNYPVYSNAVGTVIARLNQAGIRHVRDGFVADPGSAFVYFGYLQQLQQNGIRATMTTHLNLPVSTILANTLAVPNFVEAIEAPNEYDLSGDPNWASNLAAYQRTLYAGAKATPALAQIPVLGPALTSSEAYAAIGNMSAYMDNGNMHDYFAGYNPGTLGYGGGAFGGLYGSIVYNKGAAGQMSGLKPVIATETGYCTMTNVRNAIPSVLGSKYIPRAYLEQWLAGVPRTLLYELIDEGAGGCDANHGLLTQSYQPKPGYFALQRFMSTIADSGSPNRTTTALPLAITSTASTLHKLLLQKSDGTYVLALWNEVASWDVNGGSLLSPAPISVGVQLETTPSFSKTATIVDDGSLVQSDPVWDNGSTTLTIDDHVTLLKLTP